MSLDMSFKVNSQSWYYASDVQAVAHISAQIILKAYREGRLRGSEVSKKDILFLGQWVIDWLENPKMIKVIPDKASDSDNQDQEAS